MHHMVYPSPYPVYYPHHGHHMGYPPPGYPMDPSHYPVPAPTHEDAASHGDLTPEPDAEADTGVDGAVEQGVEADRASAPAQEREAELQAATGAGVTHPSGGDHTVGNGNGGPGGGGGGGGSVSVSGGGTGDVGTAESAPLAQPLPPSSGEAAVASGTALAPAPSTAPGASASASVDVGAPGTSGSSTVVPPVAAARPGMSWSTVVGRSSGGASTGAAVPKGLVGTAAPAGGAGNGVGSGAGTEDPYPDADSAYREHPGGSGDGGAGEDGEWQQPRSKRGHGHGDREREPRSHPVRDHGKGGVHATHGAVGLTNRYGENNCFLNVVVQLLHRLDPFRRRLAKAPAHDCADRKTCVICSMCSVMEAMDAAGKEAASGRPGGGRPQPVSLNRLRDALHRQLSRDGDGLFAATAMGDASEALEDIVKLLHACEVQVAAAAPPGGGARGRSAAAAAAAAASSAKGHAFVSMQDAPKDSVALGCFGILVRQSAVCTTKACGSVSGKEEQTLLALHANARSLLDVAEAVPRCAFDVALHRVSSESRGCDKEACGGIARLRRDLLQDVPVFTVSIGWDTASPAPEDVARLVSLLHPVVDLRHVFDSLVGAPPAARVPCRLRGIVAYTGTSRHYVALVDQGSSPSLTQWVFCNDESVSEITSNDGLGYCAVRGFIPHLLLYESLGVGSAAPSLKGTAVSVGGGDQAITRLAMSVAAGAGGAGAGAGAGGPAPLPLDTTAFPSLSAATSSSRKR
jgi:hypothetical protein